MWIKFLLFAEAAAFVLGAVWMLGFTVWMLREWVRYCVKPRRSKRRVRS